MGIGRLRAFEAVVTAGGFAAAARILGVSQPAVSAQVAALEREHGVRLIDRRTSLPTETGVALHEITRPLFALAEQADHLLSRARERQDAHVRVAVDAPGYAMPMLAAARSRHPELSYTVSAGNARDVLDAVRGGRADIGFAAEAPSEPGLHRVALHTQDLVAVVRTDHPRSGERTLRLADLVHEPVIGREIGSVTRAALERAVTDAGMSLEYAMLAGSREAVLAATAAGLGVGVVAEDEMLDDPRLVMLDLRDPVISVTEYLVCRAGAERSPIWRALTSSLGDG